MTTQRSAEEGPTKGCFKIFQDGMATTMAIGNAGVWYLGAISSYTIQVNLLSTPHLLNLFKRFSFCFRNSSQYEWYGDTTYGKCYKSSRRS